MAEYTRLIDLANSELNSVEISKDDWIKLKKKAQETAMTNLPKECLGRYRDPEVKKLVRREMLKVVENERPGISYEAKMSLVEKLTDEISGYGPLEKLLDDKEITEIIVERYDKLVVERGGILHEVDTKFDSEEDLRLVIERIISPLGRRLDWASPIVDARLADGSRVCAVAPPISPFGTQLTIRKFKPNISIDDLIRFGALPVELKEAIKACVQARMSIVVSGGTGSGKTTFLNAISEFINPNLSIITIENPIELRLKHPRVRAWEARPANIEGKGEINMLSLVITALRSRPDIIIVGEVRGKEAFALMQALNTGHNGSMTTLHANNAKEAMQRLVSMVSAAGELAPDLVPSYVASGIDIIIHLSRMTDGSRKVVEVAELMGEQNGVILTNQLVTYHVDSFDGHKVKGRWIRTQNEFSRKDRFRDMGIEFPGWLGGKEP